MIFVEIELEDAFLIEYYTGLTKNASNTVFQERKQEKHAIAYCIFTS
jgi:hypothetical protein